MQYSLVLQDEVTKMEKKNINKIHFDKKSVEKETIFSI